MNGIVIEYRTVLNVFIVLLFAAFLVSVLHRKWRMWITLVVLVGSTWAMMMLMKLLPYEMGALRQALGYVAMVVCAFVVFSDKWTKVLFAIGVMYADMIITEMLLAAVNPDLLTSANWMNEIAAVDRVRVIVTYVLMLGTLLFLSARLFTRATARLSTRDWLLFSMFPVSQVVILALWEMSAGQKNPSTVSAWQILSCGVCVLVDVGLYFAVRGMSQRAELKVENQLLARQIEAQKQHYAALTEQYEQVRVMRHDISNHVHTIQILLNENNTGAAREYAAETMEKNTFRSSLGACENPIADAFLFSRAEEAKARGIRVETDVRLPYQLGIANTDLITAMGNLLDNAVEAVLLLPEAERFIRISAGVKNNFLVLRVENSVSPASTKKRSRRIEGLERGLGSRILEELARQYQGTFSAGREGDLYRATITLQMDGTLL